MRYKRGRKYKSRVIKMKFQSFFDMSTADDQMQIISVSAGGPDVYNRLAPFFGAYRYYKLGSVSFKAIPASTLPIDPTGLSYEAGDFPTVDPRDQLTPGMARITNGEDILEDITGLSGDQQRELYNNMLLDPRWFKWMLQTGVKRFGKPKYWQIGQLHQDKWPGAIMNLPHYSPNSLSAGNFVFDGTSHIYKGVVEGQSEQVLNHRGLSDPRGIFQTGHRGTLGWMPTDGLQPMWDGIGNKDHVVKKAFNAAIPTIELFKILTPPMRRTKYFYRVFITETVYFKDPIVMNVNGYRPVDVFHYNTLPIPNLPTVPFSSTTTPYVDGGNDGGDDR